MNPTTASMSRRPILMVGILIALHAICSSTVLSQDLPSAPSDSLSAMNLGRVAYQKMKAQGRLPQPHQVPARVEIPPGNTISPRAVGRANGLLIPLDGSFAVAPFDDGSPPEYRNDDGSTPPLSLSFPFCLYGTTYNQVYINNNGNLSFEGPFWTYTPSGFPISDYGMVAPFWADIDTRNPSSGVVYYRSEPHRFTVIWDRVGYYSEHADKVNTFEVILTDGTDPVVGVGKNVAFSYNDMQWTTGDATGSGGFGGAPATVGANRNDGVNYALVGRFDHPGVDYDGPGGNPDGISYLDNKDFMFQVCQGLGTISGTKFYDTNENGIRDPGEAGLPGWMIMLAPDEHTTLTDADGNYFFSFLDPKTYTVSEVPLANWEQTYPPPPGTHGIALNQGQTVTGVNFGNRALAVQDLAVRVTGGLARPGRQKVYGITYENKGAIAVSGTVTLMLPTVNLLHIASSPGGTYNPSTRSVTWNVGLLSQGTREWLWTKIWISGATPLGTVLTTTVSIDPIAGDILPANNTDVETQTVRGSYDPNEKLVMPDDVIGSNETLRYQINFQNVGTDTAFNIIVRDSLDPSLDITTLQIGASSHPFVFNIVNRELNWVFTDIKLPDSIVDEPGSHGFISFKVCPFPDAPSGTIIENRAAIYFDFNPPVITNTVSNEILCECAYQVDFDEDGFLNALDLSSMIDILFGGDPDIQDPYCPSPRADFDCDGFSTALDLSGLIDHLFSGGAGPCDPCAP